MLISLQLAIAESELAELRSKSPRFRHASNPLPPPPEPLPLDRFPPFARPSASGSGYTSYTSSQPDGQANTHAANGTGSNTSHNSNYISGYPAYFIGDVGGGSFQPRPASVQAELRPAEREKHSRETRKGKAREQTPMVDASVRNVVPPKPQQTQGHSSYTSHNIYRYPKTQHDTDHPNAVRHRNGIIPGALPAQRVIPPFPKWNDTDLTSDTPMTERDRRWRERNGTNHSILEGELPYQGVGLGTSAGVADQVNGTATVPGETSDLGPDDVSDPSAPASAYVSGYASGYGYGYAYGQDFAPEYHNNHIMEPSVPQQQGIGSLGLLGIPAPALPSQSANNRLNTRSHPSDANSASRPNPPPRRNTTPTHPLVSADDFALLGHPSSRQPPRTRSNQNVSQVLGAAVGAAAVGGYARDDERDSISSWGTVHTGENARDSTRGSMSDLGLIGLPPGGVVRGSVSDSVATPIRLGFEDGGDDASYPGNEDDAHTPIMRSRSALYPPELGQDLSALGMLPGTIAIPNNVTYNTNGSNHPQHARSMSRPEIPINAEDTNTRQNRNRMHRARVDRHPPRSSSSAANGHQFSPSPGIYHSTDVHHIDPASSSDSDNALALTFDDAASNSRSRSRASSVVTEGSHNMWITVPTPIVSRRNVLRSWTLDA